MKLSKPFLSFPHFPRDPQHRAHEREAAEADKRALPPVQRFDHLHRAHSLGGHWVRYTIHHAQSVNAQRNRLPLQGVPPLYNGGITFNIIEDTIALRHRVAHMVNADTLDRVFLRHHHRHFYPLDLSAA